MGDILDVPSSPDHFLEADISTYKSEGLHVELTAVEQTPESLGLPYRFQCPPLDTVSTNFGFNHMDYDTAFEGQFSRRGGRVLRNISFQTLAVWYPASFAMTADFDLESHTDRIREIAESGAVFWFQMFHEWPFVDAAWTATLRNFSVEERAGEGDARYFNVEFTEWRDPVVFGSGTGDGADGLKGPWPKHHILKTGDTLHSLAIHYYHRVGWYNSIAIANQGLSQWGGSTPIVKHKNYKVGDRITVPKPPRLISTPSTPAKNSQHNANRNKRRR